MVFDVLNAMWVFNINMNLFRLPLNVRGLNRLFSPTWKRISAIASIVLIVLTLIPLPSRAEDMDSYLAYLDTRFGSAWRMPPGGERLRCVMSFVLFIDGNHTTATIDSSSGNQSFDSSCLMALQYAGPFRHLPPEAHPQEPIGVSFSSSGVDCWFKLAGNQSGSDRAIIQRKNAINKKIIELRQRLAKEEKAYGKEHPRVIATVYEIANWCKSDSRWKEATPLFARVLAAQTKNPKLLRHKVSTLSDIADMYSMQGMPEKAEPYFKEAMDIMEKNFPNEKLTLAKAMQNYAKVLYKLPGKQEQADAIYEKIKNINSPKPATSQTSTPSTTANPSAPSAGAQTEQNPWRPANSKEPNPWRPTNSPAPDAQPSSNPWRPSSPSVTTPSVPSNTSAPSSTTSGSTTPATAIPPATPPANAEKTPASK